MVDKINIEKTLEDLEDLYKETMTSPNPDSHRILVCYTKLALLELCGWIEETQDQIIMDYLALKSIDQTVMDEFKREVIDRNHGFKYKENFRKMLIQTVGLISLKQIEFQLENNSNNVTLSQAKILLGNIDKRRNEAAHTHLTGTTSQYDSPSTIIVQLTRVYNFFIQIENALKNL